MKNIISYQDIESLKTVRDAALEDIKQKEKRISKQLTDNNCLFDTINLIHDEKNINFTTAVDIKQPPKRYIYQEYIF